LRPRGPLWLGPSGTPPSLLSHARGRTYPGGLGLGSVPVACPPSAHQQHQRLSSGQPRPAHSALRSFTGLPALKGEREWSRASKGGAGGEQAGFVGMRSPPRGDLRVPPGAAPGAAKVASGRAVWSPWIRGASQGEIGPVGPRVGAAGGAIACPTKGRPTCLPPGAAAGDIGRGETGQSRASWTSPIPITWQRAWPSCLRLGQAALSRRCYYRAPVRRAIPPWSDPCIPAGRPRQLHRSLR
jgi:hypothetical protein